MLSSFSLMIVSHHLGRGGRRTALSRSSDKRGGRSLGMRTSILRANAPNGSGVREDGSTSVPPCLHMLSCIGVRYGRGAVGRAGECELVSLSYLDDLPSRRSGVGAWRSVDARLPRALCGKSLLVGARLLKESAVSADSFAWGSTPRRGLYPRKVSGSEHRLAWLRNGRV